MPLTRPIKATAYFPSTFIDLELSGLTTSAGISSPHNEIAEVCDALDGGGFQCPISNFVLRHCCHRTLAEFVNNDGHKARFPCGVYHVKRVEEKWGKKGEKKNSRKNAYCDKWWQTHDSYFPIFRFQDVSYVSFYLASGLGQILILYSLFFDIFFLNVDRSKWMPGNFFFPSILLLFWLL